MDQPRHYGIDRQRLPVLATSRGVPRAVKAWAQAQLTPPQRTMKGTYLEPIDGPPRFFSGDEIYELVWSEPLLSLSKPFGLSDNGLRKRCRAMDVPTPSPGYCQKAKHGSKPRRKPLPPMPAPWSVWQRLLDSRRLFL